MYANSVHAFVGLLQVQCDEAWFNMGWKLGVALIMMDAWNGIEHEYDEDLGSQMEYHEDEEKSSIWVLGLIS